MIEAAAKAAGLPLAIRIPYSANGADVTAQVLQLKEKNPSVALFVSYASDAILFMRTMKSLDYLPTMMIGDSRASPIRRSCRRWDRSRKD